MTVGKYWNQNIEDVRFYVDGEEMKPLEAFNELYSGMYGINEWYNNSEKRNFGDKTKNLNDDMGLEYYPPELRNHIQHWVDRKSQPNAQIEIDRLGEGGTTTEVYDVEVRGDANPRNTKTPFSIISGTPSENTTSRIGVRVLRDYDVDILNRSDYVDPESAVRDIISDSDDVYLESSDIDSELQARLLSGQETLDSDNLQDMVGWINEPYVHAAMDRIGGIDSQLNNEDNFDFLRSSNPEKHVYVDKDVDPEYENSNLDVMMVYDWMEGLDQGISWQDEYEESMGHHIGTLHLLNIVNWDRSAEELYWDHSPEKGGRGVVENDYEFVLWTDRDDIKEADLESAKEQAVSLKENALDQEVSEEEANNTRNSVENAYNTVIEEAKSRKIEEELSTLIVENIPKRWQKNLFEDQLLTLD